MTKTPYRLAQGKIKIQIEDLLPKMNWQGWVYQAPGVGNKGAEGAHYYFRSQTEEGSLKKATEAGRFGFTLDVEEAGQYSILLRAARDTNTPGDARNDIWIRVDGDTQSVMPEGTAELTHGGGGFVKFKGAQTSWGNARQFSTETRDDVNPTSTVLLDKGLHTITFAPRSIGFHVDSVQVVKVGKAVKPAPDGGSASAEKSHVKVWLSHDGYRDADDNLAMLVGSAQAATAASKSPLIDVAGVVFGDVKDGGQFYTLNPTGKAPAAFGVDSRFGDVAGNKKAAGNYAFYKQYAKEALDDLDRGWADYDLLAADKGGKRAWNFDATSKAQITGAAAALAADIQQAIAKTAGAATAAELVVYSAGGGANVAAEALGYLYNIGYSRAQVSKHFAVVQHGNWEKSYEAEARELTRDMTIAISDQNMATYRNGMDGPDLKHAIKGAGLTGKGFGASFADAIAVATGGKAFSGLPGNAVFATTKDASDAGAHAFAVNLDALLAAWNKRLGSGEIHTDDLWGHLIDNGGNNRLRVIWNGFDADDVAALLRSGGPVAQKPIGVVAGKLSAKIASHADDVEAFGGARSGDLELGAKATASGTKANPVGLRFAGLDLDPATEIAEAYLRFKCEETTGADGELRIEIEAGGDAASFASIGLARREWIDDEVSWDVGAWKKGAYYRTPDLSELIEAAVDGDLASADALAFRITGDGRHSAHSFDSGAAPELIIQFG